MHATMLDTLPEPRFAPAAVPMNIVKVNAPIEVRDRSANPVALGGWNVSR
jgi:hypothetical protein